MEELGLLLSEESFPWMLGEQLLEFEKHLPSSEPKNSSVCCQINGSEGMRLLGLRTLPVL